MKMLKFCPNLKPELAMNFFMEFTSCILIPLISPSLPICPLLLQSYLSLLPGG